MGKYTLVDTFLPRVNYCDLFKKIIYKMDLFLKNRASIREQGSRDGVY